MKNPPALNMSIKLRPASLALICMLLTSLSACSSSSDDEGDAGTGEDTAGMNTDGATAGDTDAGGVPEDTNTNGSPDEGSTSGDTTGDTDAGEVPEDTNTDGTTDEGSTSGDIDNGDTTSGTSEPVAMLVPAAQLPDTSDASNVKWVFDASASGLEVHVQPYVELPLASNGSPARWNAMSSFDNRVFVVDEQDGRVYEITNREANLWFDISTAVQAQHGRALSISNPFHGGVRGIAFHPNFTSNGKFYASIMEGRPSDTSTHNYISDQSGLDADSVLVEWTADTTTFEIDPGSYREIFRVGVPEYDHPIKQIAFNLSASADDADFGNLYIAHGDGSIESTLAGTGQNNDALGKILRINPLQSGDNAYTIPTDNPFINDASLPNEVYSYGHRNPHHLAFTIDGHLLATEAGRDNIEEVNLITSGGDYGWSEREGTYVHLDSGGLVNGIAALPEDDALNAYIYPAIQFGHHAGVGAAFTGEALGGGYVVENGSPIDGEFFYIDFPKTGALYHSSLTDVLAAQTTGTPSELSVAASYSATIKYDHDSNPDTQALDNNLKQIVESASGYVNVNDRVDIRILQGPRGELYLTSKRNNMAYLVTSSLPGGLSDSAARP